MSTIIRRTVMSTVLAALLTAGVSLGAGPAFAAGPTTVAKSGNILTVTAAPGTGNRLSISEDATSFFVRDLAGGVRPAAGSGCVNENGTGQVRCAKTGITQMIVSTGDLDDTVGLGAPATSQVRFEVRLGTGNDAVAANTPHSTLRGEAGNDTVNSTSSQFVSTLDGGTGTDRCFGNRNVADFRVSCEVS